MRKTLFVVMALVAVACSSKPSGTLSKSTGSFPVTITAGNGAVTIQKKPVRIVSLAPTETEILFAIGAGSQVVAADSLSDYPPEAPKTSLSAYQPNVEAIAAYHPDLVVITNDIKNLVKSLGALSIPVVLEPAATTIDDTYKEIQQLGQVTGHVGDATNVSSKMKGDIQAIVAAAPKFSTPPTYYYELDNTYFSVTSKTFIGSLIGLLGLKNIADPADTKASGGYPQLSAEFIVHANPQLIFLADTKCCGQSAAKVRARSGWSSIAAVRDGDVVGLDDDIASRWGPRIVDLLRTISGSLTNLKQAA
jgi:iron complex transport system substrate-binding protein